MKKIYIIMAVLATAMMVSCEQEKSFNDEKLGENTLVISMQGAPSTRSIEAGAVIEKGLTFELGNDDNGNMLFLEETIQDLNASWAPATKGTPVFTENVGVLYEKMGVYVGGSSNYDFYSMDNSEGSTNGTVVDGGWRYAGEYTWTKDADDFYFWMPKTDNGITGTPTYGKTDDDLSITFSYKTPGTAAAQKDLIFAARNITKAEAQGDYRVKGVPVLFNHALTGVKFAIENYDAEKNITIKSVSFSGLYDSGSCTIKPATEYNYRNKFDDKGNPTYSSGDGRVAWTLASSRGTTAIASGSFGAPVAYDDNGKFENNGNYPSSFSAAGNTKNLNDTDATQTFWLIPQAMNEAVTLTIVYTFGSTKEETWTIDFGKILANKNVVWEAGELRTYTIKIDEVNVKIEDTVSSTIKENVVITNTGNTDAFIRAALVGQWLDGNGNPVFGFTDEVFEYYEVDSWYQDQFVKTADGTHGKFEGLPGYKGKTANPNNNWYYNSKDGYYYYMFAVEPKKATGHVDDDENYIQDPLFTKYTVGTAPNVSIGGHVVYTVTFELEIATQAVTAKQLDGSDYANWYDAWENALGYDPRQQ